MVKGIKSEHAVVAGWRRDSALSSQPVCWLHSPGISDHLPAPLVLQCEKLGERQTTELGEMIFQNKVSFTILKAIRDT